MSGEFALRTIKREDIEEFSEPPNPTIKGVAWTLEGETVGIAGLAYYKNHVMGFSNIKDEMRPHLKSITTARGIIRIRGLIQMCKAPVYATAEPGEPTAPALLNRLGFVRSEENEGFYIWRN